MTKICRKVNDEKGWVVLSWAQAPVRQTHDDLLLVMNVDSSTKSTNFVNVYRLSD